MAINGKYYSGFEAEPSVEFVFFQPDGNKNVLKIWMGYFETIMDCLVTGLQRGGVRNGLTKDEWYDESPWLIEDLDFEINQLKNFTCEYVEDKEDLANILLELPKIVDDIILFLSEAKEKKVEVYLYNDY